MTNVNLGLMPSSWSPYEYGSGSQITHLETNTIYWHSGTNSIRINVHGGSSCPSTLCTDVNHERELDMPQMEDIAVGDHIIMKGWIKTSPSASTFDGNPEYGGRLGADFYGAGSIWTGSEWVGTTGLIDGISGPYGHLPQSYTEMTMNIVPWNEDWTFKQIECYAPSSIPVLYEGVTRYFYPMSWYAILPWLQAMPWWDGGTVWFADYEYYINPEEFPSVSYRYQPEVRTLDPSVDNWGPTQKGRLWYSSTSDVYKLWDGYALKTLIPV